MDYKKELSLIKKIPWEEVFGYWHNNEKDNEDWIKLYRQRGYNNWHDWRMTYAKPLLLDELDWSLYKIKEPLNIVPNFFGGPFTVWKKYYYGEKDSLQYKDLLNDKVLNRIDGKVYRLTKNFPAQTYLIGVVVDGRIVIVEGTHRCLAISLMAKDNKDFNTIVYIALAPSKLDKLPIVGGTK